MTLETTCVCLVFAHYMLDMFKTQESDVDEPINKTVPTSDDAYLIGFKSSLRRLLTVLD